MRLILRSLFVCSLLVHCGGSAASDDTIAPDASGDSTLDAPSSDAPASDAPSEATLTDGGADYCAMFTANQTTCNNTDACTQAREAECPTLISYYSGQFLAAYESCDSKWACPDGGPDTQGGAAFRQCIAGKLTPDGAAQQLSQDVCASCVAANKETMCEQNFYATTGVEILEYDDAIISAVDNACGAVDAGTGGEAGACIAAFTDCATKKLREQLPPPPAACTDN